MKWTSLSQPTGEDHFGRLSRLPPHELLGVPLHASDAELTAAYRRLVAKYHPDRLDDFLKPYSDRLVRLINAAYDVERARRHV